MATNDERILKPFGCSVSVRIVEELRWKFLKNSCLSSSFNDMMFDIYATLMPPFFLLLGLFKKVIWSDQRVESADKCCTFWEMAGKEFDKPPGPIPIGRPIYQCHLNIDYIYCFSSSTRDQYGQIRDSWQMRQIQTNWDCFNAHMEAAVMLSCR